MRRVLLCLSIVLAFPAAATAAVVTNSNGAARTGFYPGQTQLDPASVTFGDFGPIFDQRVEGQVYAQPLVSNGTLLVATEANRLYGLDPATGQERWTRRLGPTFRAQDPPISCGDLQPEVGITSTPVIDSAGTGTAYLVSKTGADDPTFPLGAAVMHAVNLADGQERPGFPVQLAGAADNDPGVIFDGSHQLQRAGLLLLDGVVYAGFAGHCDERPYQGWVMGVAAATGQVKARWSSVPEGSSGGGIWQAGVGLASDGPGSILLATGNGTKNDGTPNPPRVPRAGSTPPKELSEALVRLTVQSDGKLEPTDFFTPSNAEAMDRNDADFGAGGPVVLPPPFGGPAAPRTAAVAGKEGILYHVDRDDLGGIYQGTGGGDRVVHETPQRGAVYGRPGVWPSGPGWLYLATAYGAGGGDDQRLDVYRQELTDGRPALVRCASSPDGDGISLGSSSPIVTSNGIGDDSAVVWVVAMAARDGAGAQLRAYEAEPECGSTMTPLRSFALGTGTRYGLPGVASSRLYVGTLDGHVRGFGRPSTPVLTSAGGGFGTVTIGQRADRTVTLTSHEAGLKVTGLAVDAGPFAFQGAPPALPRTLAKDGTLDVGVTYAPSAASRQGASLRVTVQRLDGTVQVVPVALSGRGRPPTGALQSSPRVLDLGGVAYGTAVEKEVVLRNAGATTLQITGVGLPGAPVTVTGLPATPFSIAPDASVVARLRFAPVTAGRYDSALTLSTTGAEEEEQRRVELTGSGGSPGRLELPPVVDFGQVRLGTSAVREVLVRNTGDTALRLPKAKVPVGPGFTWSSPVDEGSTLQGNSEARATMTFAPTLDGPAEATWSLTADDGQGARTVRFSGVGQAAPAPTPTQPPATTAAPTSPASPPEPGPQPAPAVAAARLTLARVDGDRIRRGRGPGPAFLTKAPRRPAGFLRFTLDHASSVRVTMSRRKGGRDIQLRGSEVLTGRSGPARIVLTGRWGRRPLASGSYAFTLTPAGGTPVKARFIAR